MAVNYAESNKESTLDLYLKRMSYYNTVQSTATVYTNLVDFNFAEKYLYGRVNRLLSLIHI